MKIEKGQEASQNLTEVELQKITCLWTEKDFIAELPPMSESRQKLEQLLSSEVVGEKIAGLIENVRNKVSRLIPSVKSPAKIRDEQYWERFGFIKEFLNESIGKGDVVVARIDGELAGAAFINQLNDDVVEINKGIVLPKFREKGIYKRIREMAITRIAEKYPNVKVLSCTKSEIIKKMSRNEGWSEIGMEEYYRLHKVPEYVIEQRKEKLAKEGWTAYMIEVGG
jgi:hypothetical protein